MPRAPYNVLVIPYRLAANGYEFAVFRRADGSMWQFIAGGGEGDEVPWSAAQREAREEGGLAGAHVWTALDARASIPRTAFPGAGWPGDVYVVPEFCFAVDVGAADLRLSAEHDRIEWLDHAAAADRLTWDSNRVALWELTERLRRSPATPLPAVGPSDRREPAPSRPRESPRDV
jgi:dATP pyrophosphohydrolase